MEPLRVRPEDLHRAGEGILAAMAVSAAEHVAHHDDMEAAAPGIPVEAAGALQAMVASWTEQRWATHGQLEEMGMATQDAAAEYGSTDDAQGAIVNHLDMGL